MTRIRHLISWTALLNMAGLAACQTVAASPPSPAVLASADAQTMKTLTKTLARAMGKSNVTLGAGSPDQNSVISVLPPRSLSGIDPSLPTRFDIMMEGRNCYVVKRKTGEKYPLENIACRPITSN